ncbi:unnamed protein product [Rotaria magnacalcarata]|uniref:Uncharacterized protein n=1 Tax=Rotaria magnacalcarata TaxID=392030 RepID=A0A816S256_9BILA|nr:unnamed protein product [Rotaria magnacalcarata]CAF1253122.1 unnamed protein product [Rotaria magnacalcarata]CAF2076702.1 unnamed protein product [Rotaria magnacalcarata]CAF3801434.1 unnamed protein product [Rotaria magnacalcarata]CAF4250375.1 unnamed protein product [Rotaria magnacalcarata]
MVVESNTSSLIWDSSSSPFQFQSSSLSNIPSYFDRSLVAPLTLSRRHRSSHSTALQLPPLKLRSTLTWHSSEEETFLAQSLSTSEHELNLFKQKFDRLRASLTQSIQAGRHAFNKANYQRTSVQQMCDERDQLIDELLTSSIELNDRIEQLQDEIITQRRKRDSHEMRQLKLKRKKTRLNQTKDKAAEKLKQNDKTKFMEQYNSHILQLKNAHQQELIDRDNEIQELKAKFFQTFNYQAEEHMKLIRATIEAFDSENEKCDILKEIVDDYEINVYRARKPCCIPTSFRLSQLSTQLRLYLIIELALHEVFRSSCSCGQFRRCYQTYLRLHKKQN